MSALFLLYNDADAQKKINEMAVKVGEGLNRTDMNAADYTEALNRLAAQGWQLVTVNKSNYWIFRKKK